MDRFSIPSIQLKKWLKFSINYNSTSSSSWCQSHRWNTAKMVVLLEGSPISTEELWSSVILTIGLLVSSLTNALLPRLLSLAGLPALGSLRGSKLLPFKNDGSHCALGSFNVVEIVPYPSPDLCLNTILSQTSMDNSFDLMAWFLSWHALSTVGPYEDRCVPFQMISNQLNLTQVDSNQVVETSQGWSMETGCMDSVFNFE